MESMVWLGYNNIVLALIAEEIISVTFLFVWDIELSS